VDHLRWRLVWESDLSDDEHAALARLFGRAYPRHAERFSGGRSWSGARPEARVVGSLDDRPVAHLGLLRRFLRVPATGASLLVGDVGLVAVDPDLQGRGIGRRLLDQARQVLLELDRELALADLPERVPGAECEGDPGDRDGHEDDDQDHLAVGDREQGIERRNRHTPRVDQLPFQAH